MIMTPGTNEQVFIPLFLFLPKCYESQAFLRESQAFLLKCSIANAMRFQGEPTKVPLENPSFSQCGGGNLRKRCFIKHLFP